MRYHCVYKTTCKVTKEYYVGVHSTDCLEDNYMGSGVLLRERIKRYGVHNFSKEIIFIASSREEAFLKEKELVTSDFLKDPLVLNLIPGGSYSKDGLQSPLIGAAVRKFWKNASPEYKKEHGKRIAEIASSRPDSVKFEIKKKKTVWWSSRSSIYKNKRKAENSKASKDLWLKKFFKNEKGEWESVKPEYEAQLKNLIAGGYANKFFIVKTLPIYENLINFLDPFMGSTIPDKFLESLCKTHLKDSETFNNIKIDNLLNFFSYVKGYERKVEVKKSLVLAAYSDFLNRKSLYNSLSYSTFKGLHSKNLEFIPFYKKFFENLPELLDIVRNPTVTNSFFSQDPFIRENFPFRETQISYLQKLGVLEESGVSYISAKSKSGKTVKSKTPKTLYNLRKPFENVLMLEIEGDIANVYKTVDDEGTIRAVRIRSFFG